MFGDGWFWGWVSFVLVSLCNIVIVRISRSYCLISTSNKYVL